MGDYQLDRFNLMLVEDNGYVRHTLEDLLRQFRIGQISSFRSGEEAIKHLKEQRQAGHPGPDIVLCDLLMSPIDGLLVLRWVRTSKESPNRFVPFMMISGAADRDQVADARDLGVSEFIAKPFSVNSVFRYLAQTIERPRPFIVTQEYFGPDRRRNKSAPPGGADERRRPGEDHVTVVYSAEKTVKPSKPSDVWCFKLPNALKQKAGGGDGGPPSLPADIMAEAEASLERSALDFTTWARDYLNNLSTLCDAADENPAARANRFVEINELAHELRGQGGTFGYPLISTFGKMLYDATGPGMPLTDNRVDIVRAHVDAMRAVIRDKVAGDGGELGKELMASLQQAIERYQMVE